MTRAPADRSPILGGCCNWRADGEISGALDLPQQLRVLPINSGQRLFALVYEFESVVGGETRVISPGRWTMEHHFRNAGLLKNP